MPKCACLRWSFRLASWEPSLSECQKALASIQPEEVRRINEFCYIQDAKAALVGRLLLRYLLTFNLKTKVYWLGNPFLSLKDRQSCKPSNDTVGKNPGPRFPLSGQPKENRFWPVMTSLVPISVSTFRTMAILWFCVWTITLAVLVALMLWSWKNHVITMDFSYIYIRLIMYDFMDFSRKNFWNFDLDATSVFRPRISIDAKSVLWWTKSVHVLPLLGIFFKDNTVTLYIYTVGILLLLVPKRKLHQSQRRRNPQSAGKLGFSALQPTSYCRNYCHWYSNGAKWHCRWCSRVEIWRNPFGSQTPDCSV